MGQEHKHPECFKAEEGNDYPLCVGGDKAECEECQLRADREPEDPYGVEHRHTQKDTATDKQYDCGCCQREDAPCEYCIRDAGNTDKENPNLEDCYYHD